MKALDRAQEVLRRMEDLSYHHAVSGSPEWDMYTDQISLIEELTHDASKRATLIQQRRPYLGTTPANVLEHGLASGHDFDGGLEQHGGPDGQRDSGRPERFEEDDGPEAPF